MAGKFLIMESEEEIRELIRAMVVVAGSEAECVSPKELSDYALGLKSFEGVAGIIIGDPPRDEELMPDDALPGYWGIAGRLSGIYPRGKIISFSISRRLAEARPWAGYKILKPDINGLRRAIEEIVSPKII